MENRSASRRAFRRHCAIVIGARRRRIHLAQVHGGPRSREVDCVCELAPMYFDKSHGCSRCSKKTRGRPKIGRGCCYAFERRATAVERTRAHRLCHDLAVGRIDVWSV